MTNSPAKPAEAPVDVRFVVLFHQQREGDHFDLMIESGESLATWKMTLPPEQANAEGLACRRIAAHRRRYLDYEGPVSGDRGWVKVHDSGRCMVRVSPGGSWCVQFDGGTLAGRFELVQSASGADSESWLLRRLA